MSENDPFGKDWTESEIPAQDEKERLEEELRQVEEQVDVLERIQDDYQEIESIISSDEVDIVYDRHGNRFELILTYNLSERGI